MDKEYADYVRELSTTRPALAHEIEGWHGLDAVLTWMQAQGLPPGSVDLIGQDEFEYDFLIHLQPTDEWLVFGVT